jgi:hypothetical protein
MIQRLKKLFSKHDTRREQEATGPAKNEVDNFVVSLTPGERRLLLEMLKFNPPYTKHLPPVVRLEVWDLYQDVYLKLCSTNNAVSATKKI